MAEEEKTVILGVQVNNSAAIKSIAEYMKSLDELKKKETELKNVIKQGGTESQKAREELAKNKIVQSEYSKGIQELNKEIRNNITEEKKQEGSLTSLRAQLSNLTKEYDNLSRVEREGAKGKELQDKINAVTDELKGAEEATQRYYRSVGSYKDAIIQAANANVPFLDQINKMATQMNGLKGYLGSVATEFVSVAKATTGLNKVLKLLRLAIISTGIGALVVALGSLIAYFSQTQAGIELCSKAMSALGAVINVIIERIAKIGSAIINLFSGNFKQAGEDMKNAFKGIGEEIKNDVKLAIDLNDALTKLEKQEVMLAMRRSTNKAEIERLKKTSEDTTKSIKERTEAAQKAADIEKEDLKIQTQIQEARLANMLGYTKMTDQVKEIFQQIKNGDITADELMKKMGPSEATFDDVKEFKDGFVELQGLYEESYGKQTELQNTLNSIRQEGAEKAKAAKDAEVEAVRAAEDAMLSLVKDGAEKQRQEINANYDRQIADLQRTLQTEKDLTAKARQAINTQIQALEKKRIQELDKVSDEEIALEAEKQARIIEVRLAAVKEGSDAEFELKMQQLQLQKEAEIRNAEETGVAVADINAKYDKLITDFQTQAAEARRQKMVDEISLEWDNRIKEAQLRGDETLQLELERRKYELDSLHQLEGESDAEFKARQLEAYQNYVDAKEAIKDKEIEIETAKMEALSQISGAISGIFDALGEDSKAALIVSKITALAQIAIDQGMAIASATRAAAESSFSVWDLAAKIAIAVATVTTNMISAIKSVKSAKFAEGGLVTGPGSGTSDSVPARLSNGESVNNALSTSMFAPLYSALNQLGGGAPISLPDNANQAIGEDMLARAVAKGVAAMPAPVVSVQEISRVSKRVSVVENLGDL